MLCFMLINVKNAIALSIRHHRFLGTINKYVHFCYYNEKSHPCLQAGMASKIDITIDIEKLKRLQDAVDFWLNDELNRVVIL